MNKKRITSTICLTLMLIVSLVLGGCQSGGTGNNDSEKETAQEERVKIIMDNNSTEQYQQLFNEIAEELGIVIDLVVAPDNYELFLQTQLQSSDPPDLFKLPGWQVTAFVNDELTVDLNTYFNGSWKEELGADWDALAKGVFNQHRREANDATKQTDDQDAPLWAIPFDAGCQSFGVNRGIIESSAELSGKLDEMVSVGLVPCKPWELGSDGQVEAYTHTEFKELLKGFQEIISAGNLAGDAENLQYAFQGNDALKLMVYSANASFLNETSDTVTLLDDAIVDVFHFIKEGINEGYINSMQDGGEGWNNWTAGMHLISGNTGTWEYATYLELEKDIAMIPVPVPDNAPRTQWTGGQTGSAMGIRKGSQNEELAAAVMCSFISRDSENFQLENAMNMPIYEDSWQKFIDGNDPVNGFFPYDAGTKEVFNNVISGGHGRPQETYFTVGRTWWSTLGDDFVNVFCLDPSIETREDVQNWLEAQESAIQTLLESGQ